MPRGSLARCVGIGAIRVTRRGGGTALTFAVTNPSADATAFLVTFAGAGVADGVYDLSVQSTLLQAKSYLAQPLTGGDRTFHRLLGDFDGDADVNVADFVLFRRLISTPPPSGVNADVLDLNGDGRLNARDLIDLRRRLGARLV